MSIKEWVFTTDHKRVGILYLVGSLAAFAVAGIMALLMRAELSALGPTTTSNTALYTFTVLVLGFASIIGGVNFLTTVAYMRAPGLKWTNLNIFVWCILGAFVLQLIFVPVLGTAVTLISFDKYLGTNFFDPTKGGDVLTYQNLFWFYSH